MKLYKQVTLFVISSFISISFNVNANATNSVPVAKRDHYTHYQSATYHKKNKHRCAKKYYPNRFKKKHHRYKNQYKGRYYSQQYQDNKQYPDNKEQAFLAAFMIDESFNNDHIAQSHYYGRNHKKKYYNGKQYNCRKKYRRRYYN